MNLRELHEYISTFEVMKLLITLTRRNIKSPKLSRV